MKNQRGVTLIEIMVVLVIIGIGAIALYSVLQNKGVIERTQDDEYGFLSPSSAHAMGDFKTTKSVEQKAAEKKKRQVKTLLQNQPTKEFRYSMDRKILNDRNLRLNDPNKMVYLYVVMLDGTWCKFTIIGKVASTSKRLNPPVKKIRMDSGQYNTDTLAPAADEMGTWGSSTGSKVGLSTIGSLIEFGGFISWILSETPIMFSGLDKPMVEVNVEATATEKEAFLGELRKLKEEYRQIMGR